MKGELMDLFSGKKGGDKPLQLRTVYTFLQVYEVILENI
jgi:hypothetical protein